MLLLKDKSDVVRVHVKSDFYVPIDIDFGFWDVSIDPTLYWRTGDFKKKDIEIGIGKKRGEARSITLISRPKCKIQNIEKHFMDISEERGLPLFDTKRWNDDTSLDEVGDFEIYIIDSSLIINFASNEIQSKLINDRVVFYFDKEKQLCSVEIKDFSIDEMNNLKEYLKVKK